MKVDDEHDEFEHKGKVVIICGKTASGKTGFSIDLAKKINGEIVNCDSTQFYSFVKIGTAFPSKEELEAVPSYLFGFEKKPVDINVDFFSKMIEEKCLSILKRKKVPIIVGGSHFYIYKLFYKTKNDKSENESLEFNKKIKEKRKFYEKFENKELYDLLKIKSEKRSSKINLNDRYRIILSLSIIDVLGFFPEEEFCPLFNYEIIEKKIDNLELKDKIKKRAESFFEKKKIELEYKSLKKEEKDFVLKKNFIGYRAVKEFLEEKISKIEAIEKISNETFIYAKKQEKFIRKLKKIAFEKFIKWKEE